MPQTVTHREFRVEARRPGEKWRFIPFAGAGPTTHRERAVAAIERDKRYGGGYEYRILSREKTVTTTDWEEES